MEWEPFVEEGVLAASANAKADSMPRLTDAWNSAIEARRECLDFRYDTADAAQREAMTAAGESLCNYYGFRFAEPVTLDASRRLCVAFLKPGIGDRIFDRAHILNAMLPLPNEQLDEDDEKRVRHSVGASAELASMVESFVFFQ